MVAAQPALWSRERCRGVESHQRHGKGVEGPRNCRYILCHDGRVGGLSKRDLDAKAPKMRGDGR